MSDRPIIRYAPAGVLAEVGRMYEEANQADSAGQHAKAAKLRQNADAMRRVAVRHAIADADRALGRD